MGRIIVLDEHTANKIAAGEVVERPASIVKELCENSIDAGATSITVEIKNGGISYIKIVDNGSGIGKDDVEIAFEKHSTSKIRSADDLHSIATMGFRGEALASIAAVSKVELVTRTAGDLEGSKIIIEGGNAGKREDAGCPIGTSITARDLFFNTPARYKFLKKDYTEAGYIEDVVTRLALGYPNISFKFINSKSLALQTPGNNDLLSCAYSIFGSTAKSTVGVDYEESNIKITGLAGKPEIARANRSNQILFINRRYIKNKTITTAVEEAYKTLISAGKFPFVILNLELDPQHVDVNVHPTKQEVRFSDENQIFRVTYHAIKNALFCETDLVPEFESKPQGKDSRGFRMDLPQNKPQTFEQRKLTNAMNNNSKSIFSPRLSQPNYGNNYKEKPESKVLNDIKESGVRTENNGVNSLQPEIIVKEDRENYLSVKIVGTAFATYIIAEFNDDLYIIDQHAAHERVMYEKLKREWEKGSQLSQILLIPEIMELTHKEISIIEHNRDIIANIGFNIEPFGFNTVKVSAVPLVDGKANSKDMLLDIIDGLNNLPKTGDKKVEENLLYSLACKSAVRASSILSEKEIAGLLDSMMDLENPYTCPHGRPTAIKMTRREIEKKFGRT